MAKDAIQIFLSLTKAKLMGSGTTLVVGRLPVNAPFVRFTSPIASIGTEITINPVAVGDRCLLSQHRAAD